MAISTGTYSAIPGSPSSGDLYFLTDSFYNVLYYNGSSWDHLLHGKLLTIPPSFAWVNQGGSDTVSTSNGGESMVAPNAGGSQCRIRKVAAPSTPYTITAAILPTFIGADLNFGGLLFRESSSGKLMTLSYGYSDASGVGKMTIIDWSGPSSAVSNKITPTRTDVMMSSSLIFLRIEDDGTNRKYYFSGDGINFVELYSEGRTTYMTANEVGWFLNPFSQNMKATLIHWKQT